MDEESGRANRDEEINMRRTNEDTLKERGGNPPNIEGSYKRILYLQVTMSGAWLSARAAKGACR